MRIYPFEAIYPNIELIASPDTFFETVKFEYAQYEQSGFFKTDEENALFIYEIISAHFRSVALIACTDIHDYLEGKILRHENTLVVQEQQMMNLLLQRGAMIKPVVLAYEGVDEVNDLIATAVKQEPFLALDFATGERHVIYKITDQALQKQIAKAFRKGVPKAYIADGHHRCSTAAKLYHTVTEVQEHPLDFSKMLCAFFAFDQLQIHDYNRVVDLMHGISPTVLMAKLSRLCTIKHLITPCKPNEKHEMTLYLQGEWYRLRWRRQVLRRYSDKKVIFDTHILNAEVLGPLLGIQDVTSDYRLRYVEGTSGIEGVIDKTHRADARIAFCIYPVTAKEIMRMADAGKTLPPKSTWFEPRIKNGLIAKAF